MATLDDFVSFLQGASNSAASNLSAPVDGINWLLGKAGLPVSKTPVGGSDWLRQAGFTAEPKNANAGLLGESVGGVLPIVAAAKAPQIAAGMNRVAANAAAPRTLNPQTGAIVWHGSPHKFDKFDSSKIGTGEGAQAYGHGLYLAESDRVAKQYADTLTNKAPKYLDGVPADQLSTAQKSALGLLSDAGGNANAALLAAKTDMARAGGAGAEFHVERYNALRDIAKGKIKAQVGEPSLYKVDLPDEHIAKMLDWDKPLSEQAPEVQVGLQNSGLLKYADDYFKVNKKTAPTGADLHDFLKYSGYDQWELSSKMADQGIPGIRYLDGGSRGTGQGTSNFVVFPGNEGLLTILERNGQALR